MLILTGILIILILPLITIGLSYSRLRQGLLWVVVVSGIFLSWVLFIFSGRQLPIEVPILVWKPEVVFDTSITLLMDGVSFPFAIAVITLALAFLLADIVHYRQLNIQVWALGLILSGMGLIAILAGNPLTLLLAWAVMDISEIVVLLEYIVESKARERMVADFSLRLMGLILVVVAMIQAESQNITWGFQTISPDISIYLLLAAILRLGVVPVRRDYFQDTSLNRGLGTVLHISPVVASVVLLIRVASIGINVQWLGIVTICSAIVSVLSAWLWFRAKDELQGRSDWILSILCFVVVTAGHGLELAGTAWGLALIFSGAILFLYSTRHQFVMYIVLLGALGFSGLPFTPTWAGVALFVAIPMGTRILFLIALALLFSGYVRHTRRPEEQSDGFERWMWLIYPIGLGFLLLTYFALAVYQYLHDPQSISRNTSGWWYGVIAIVIATIFILISHRSSPTSFDELSSRAQKINLSFIYRIFWKLYQWLGRFITFLSNLLEGEGGILWALLVLILLVVSLSLMEAGNGFEF